MSKHFSVPFPFQHFSHLVRIKKKSSNKWNSFGGLIMIFDHPLSPIVIRHISPKTNSNETGPPSKTDTGHPPPRPYPPQGTPVVQDLLKRPNWGTPTPSNASGKIAAALGTANWSSAHTSGRLASLSRPRGLTESSQKIRWKANHTHPC